MTEPAATVSDYSCVSVVDPFQPCSDACRKRAHSKRRLPGDFGGGADYRRRKMFSTVLGVEAVPEIEAYDAARPDGWWVWARGDLQRYTAEC